MQEFDIALHHHLVVKRKKRLVVLMALDNLDVLHAADASDTAALRQYMRQYTYVDYTADDWVDQLLYALPLRGMDHLELERAEWAARAEREALGFDDDGDARPLLQL